MTESDEARRNHLILTSTRTPKPLLANAITALREAPAWQGVLAYDEFAMQTIVDDAPPWDLQIGAPRAWVSHDDLLSAEWLQRAGISVNAATAAQAVEAVARDGHLILFAITYPACNTTASPVSILGFQPALEPRIRRTTRRLVGRC